MKKKMCMTNSKTNAQPPRTWGQRQSYKHSTQDDQLTIAVLESKPLLSFDEMPDSLKTILGLGRQKDDGREFLKTKTLVKDLAKKFYKRCWTVMNFLFKLPQTNRRRRLGPHTKQN